MFGTQFNIAHIEPGSEIYGPGNRFVVWLQGCTLGCKGCWNTAMWPHKANRLVERGALLELILIEPDIDGITLLGGEPLQQAENLSWLLQQLGESQLDVMLYTGYELPEIQLLPIAPVIDKNVDILITGRYEQSLRNTSLLWRGSENQQVSFLSNRYEEKDFIDCNQVEIHIDEFGATIVLGYPEVPL